LRDGAPDFGMLCPGRDKGGGSGAVFAVGSIFKAEASQFLSRFFAVSKPIPDIRLAWH
jgi:hypothetical protein